MPLLNSTINSVLRMRWYRKVLLLTVCLCVIYSMVYSTCVKFVACCSYIKSVPNKRELSLHVQGDAVKNSDMPANKT